MDLTHGIFKRKTSEAKEEVKKRLDEFTKLEVDSIVSSVGTMDKKKLQGDACYDTGELDSPVIIGADYLPLYELKELKDNKSYTSQISIFRNFMLKVYNAANRCKKDKCGGHGDCQPVSKNWKRSTELKFDSYSDDDFDKFFIQEEKYCIYTSEYFEEKREKERKEKKEKKDKEKISANDKIVLKVLKDHYSGHAENAKDKPVYLTKSDDPSGEDKYVIWSEKNWISDGDIP